MDGDPAGLVSIEVKSPSARSTDVADVANRAALDGQAGDAPGGFGLGSGANATSDLCPDPVSLTVPLRDLGGGRLSTGRRVIRLQATTVAGKRDTDALVLTCEPSTCGNGTVEAHEDCDDSNRANGDGCDRGCQAE